MDEKMWLVKANLLNELPKDYCKNYGRKNHHAIMCIDCHVRDELNAIFEEIKNMSTELTPDLEEKITMKVEEHFSDLASKGKQFGALDVAIFTIQKLHDLMNVSNEVQKNSSFSTEQDSELIVSTIQNSLRSRTSELMDDVESSKSAEIGKDEKKVEEEHDEDCECFECEEKGERKT